MGFLSGAYGKLMAGQLVRDLQYQMTSVQSRLRQVTREIGQKEKFYQIQERNIKQQMQLQMQRAMFGFLGLGTEVNFGAMDANTAMNMFSGIDTTAYSKASQLAQMKYMSAQTIWQNMFEMQRDADLQALKDLEQDLQTEKDNLETRYKTAENEYQAKKDEEKQGAQNIKPDYTGQGQ